MIKNDFTLLLDELEAAWRERHMAKALPARMTKPLKVTRLDEADIRGMGRLAKAVQAQTERQREEQQRAHRARAAAERTTRFREVLAKATTALHADVLAGKIGAYEAGKNQAMLHRLSARLPIWGSR